MDNDDQSVASIRRFGYYCRVVGRLAALDMADYQAPGLESVHAGIPQV